MNVIENKKLSNLMTEKIVVDCESGAILLQKDNKTIDITNDILELVVASIEDMQTFILWGRKISISVKEEI